MNLYFLYQLKIINCPKGLTKRQFKKINERLVGSGIQPIKKPSDLGKVRSIYLYWSFPSETEEQMSTLDVSLYRSPARVTLEEFFQRVRHPKLDKAWKIIQYVGWTHNTYARDKNGKLVAALSDYAVCYCALGAIAKANNLPGSSVEMITKRSEVEKKMPRGIRNIVEWNDAPSTTKHEVIQTLKALDI